MGLQNFDSYVFWFRKCEANALTMSLTFYTNSLKCLQTDKDKKGMYEYSLSKMKKNTHCAYIYVQKCP